MVEITESKKSETNNENTSDDSEHKSYKLYNFRRPDKFSKDNLRALRSPETTKEVSTDLST